MNHNSSYKSQVPISAVELRTGTAYANLMANRRLFVAAMGEYLGVHPDDVIPTTGATGAIEAVRNNVVRTRRKTSPTVLTVRPGYWRARESFEGFGFQMIELNTEPHGFTIDEAALLEKGREVMPDLLYLSLPNNPTGAIFDPEVIINGAPEGTAIMIDLTLPSRALDAGELTGRLYQLFRGRRDLFLIGSTSKSHNTAEYRIGWAVCAHSENAEQLRKENRSDVASVSVMEAIKQLGRKQTVVGMIENSFALLREGEQGGAFDLVKPQRMAETAYALIRSHEDAENLRASFNQHGISVMWGSEFGLTDEYIRLEMSEPRNINIFVDVINSCLTKKAVGLMSPGKSTK
jgi:aspartate/methionine/tyrosine aminotransferase